MTLHGFDDYEPATNEENLAFARGILSRLHGVSLKGLEVAEDGPCDDCGRVTARLEYGKARVCRLCAQRRRKAEPAAGEHLTHDPFDAGLRSVILPRSRRAA